MRTRSSDLVDAAGRQHRPFLAEPRIVSLVPSITELLCALGLAHVLVGRTGFCIHPRASLKRVPKVGGTKDVKLDRIAALAPTHVIVNIDENRAEDAAALARFVPHIIVTHPLRPRDNIALYRLLGALFGRAAEARMLADRFEAALAACRAATRHCAPERVLYLIWREPWMTVSRNTYIARTLGLVGWKTVPARATSRYPAIALDAARRENIDRVLLSSEPYRFTERHAEALRAEPVLARKPVTLIDGEATSWYGSRAIAGLDYLVKLRLALSAGRPGESSMERAEG